MSGVAPWRDVLIAGDNLGAGPLLRERHEGQVDLIYIDPPFATERAFAMRPPASEGEEAPLEGVAYRDRWKNEAGVFLDFLGPRLELCRALLAPHGTIYVHLDYRRIHHARLLLDGIFGERCFRNEIIWHYRSGGRQPSSFAFKHDTLLAYGKTTAPYFNGAAVAVPRETLRRNKMKRAVDEDGRSYRTIRSGGKEYRYYDDEGVVPDDVWTDISHLQQRDPERTGYPTQKPEKLLERIVLASCPEGGLVADLFCGSGTTLAVARRLGRRWIGCDASPLAIETVQRRLAPSSFDLVRPGDVV